MPTYEYECLTNGHRFEIRQSFSDAALTECVECGQPVRKVLSAAGIIFKGSGYYVTDTRKASSSSKKSASPASSSKSDSSSSSSGASSSSTTSSGGSSSSSSD